MVIKNVSTLKIKKFDIPRNFLLPILKITYNSKIHRFLSDALKMSINSDHVIVFCFIMTDTTLDSLILQHS